MKKSPLVALTFCLLCATVLVGCSDGNGDIRQWMTEQQNQTHPTVPPLDAPKKFTPQAYTEASSTAPFEIQKLTQALKRDSNQSDNAALVAPELVRLKEPLESYPLDSMTMVGILDQKGRQVALVKTNNLIYQVQVGSYLGLNYGRVTKITGTEISLREIVQDGNSQWIERMTTLQLQMQEKSK